MRYVVIVTLLRGEPIRFFGKGTTREESHEEGLQYIREWPLNAPNQPCRVRIEESRWLFPDIDTQNPKENP